MRSAGGRRDGLQGVMEIEVERGVATVTDRPGFLAHRRGDDVAIAVRDVAAGANTVVYLDSGAKEGNVVLEAIRLGHKVALRDLEEGEDVIEYGSRIGVTSTRVRAGELVHVHNLTSARWTRPN